MGQPSGSIIESGMGSSRVAPERRGSGPAHEPERCASTVSRFSFRGRGRSLGVVQAVWMILVLGAFPIQAAPVPVEAASASHPDLRSGGRDRGDAKALSIGPRAGVGVLNEDSGLVYGSIAAAIAAASAGDSLVVQAATLPEGLVDVDRSLSLRGATGAEIVQATTDTTDTGDGRGWFLVQPGVDLQVSNLSFEGDGREIYHAFRVRGTASFFGVRFSGIRFGTYQGSAVVAFGDGPLEVDACSFEDIGRIGVFLFGPTVAGSAVRSSTFVGKGLGDHLDYPLEISGGATATVEGNHISEVRGVAAVDDSISAGILASTTFGAGTAVTATSNQFVDNSFGIVTNSGDSSALFARFNRFFGNDTAVLNGSSSAPDLELDWWGCNDGPGTALCDAVVDRAGAAASLSDPWLVLGLTLEPVPAILGQTFDAAADLTFDSDAADVSGLGAVDDGIPIGFDAAPAGTAMPAVAPTVSGVATTTIEVVALGSGQVAATLDNQTVTAQFLADVEVPVTGAVGKAILILSLLAAALLVLRLRG